MSGPRVPFWKQLRVRFVAAFAGLAVLPFLVSMGVLYHLARQDALEVTGTSLAEDTSFLAKEVELEMRRMAEWGDLLASHPDVRRSAAQGQPLPPGFLNELARLYPSVERVELVPSGDDDEKPALRLEPGGVIGYKPSVRDEAGRARGALLLSFSSMEMRRLVEEFRKGREGAAFLLTTEAVLASSSQGEKPPPAEQLVFATPWTRYKDERSYRFLSASRIGGSDPFFSGEWKVALSLSEETAMAAFDLATAQLFIIAVVLAAIVLGLAGQMADRFHRPIVALHQGAEIISRINLSHRLTVNTGDELELLAEEFNHMAGALENAYGELERRIAEMTGDLQKERNRLADVLRTMVEGLVVANEAGEALLMNPRARALLVRGPESGIGLPLSRLLPAERVEYHLRRLRAAWDEGGVAVEQALFPFADGRLLRGVLRAIPGPGGARAGFLLVFRDVEEEAALEASAHELLRAMPEALKGSLSTIHSLSEVLRRKPDLAPDKREAFWNGLREETLKAVRVLEQTLAAAPDVRPVRWPAQPADPAALLREALLTRPDLAVEVDEPPGPLARVGVEPFACVASLRAVLGWLASLGVGAVKARVEDAEESVLVTFSLPAGAKTDPAALNALLLEAAGEPTLSLPEAVRRNRGEVWATRREGVFEVRFAMLKASALSGAEGSPELVEDHPEFYDFDLFTRPAKGAGGLAQLDTPLAELEFVVFDTETTGLDLSGGDRVVSLSGVRVRGGRVNRADTFHTLVNPGRPIPPASTAVHGITDDMVAGAPDIGDILPRFSQWVGDAVLVAHNAAFDKKVLDLSAGERGLSTLENQILDTLFLSYGVHGDLEGHSLEAIAQRMGIAVEGRHTSLGDSLTTAQIFLQLLPLLAPRGVTTLGQAKAFCDKMLLLRWRSSRF